MKNSIMNLLRGGVFLFAVIAAFAFTKPIANNSMLFAYEVEDEEGKWVPIPGLVENVHYACPGPPQPCTATFTDDDPVNGEIQVISEGVFTRLP